MVSQREISRAQLIIKRRVDEYLKSAEPEALRYTKVGISVDKDVCTLHIKICLDRPLRLSSIVEVMKIVSSIVDAEDWMIYSPHARAIRISAKIKSTEKITY